MLLYILITVTCCFVAVFKSLISVHCVCQLFDIAVLQFAVILWNEVCALADITSTEFIVELTLVTWSTVGNSNPISLPAS